MPFNLQIPDRTADFTLGGMSSIADTITKASEHLEKQREEQKAITDSAKHFDALAKLNPKLKEMLPATYEHMGAPERIRAMTAALATVKMQAEEQKAKQSTAEHNARLNQYAMQEQTAMAKQEEEASRTGFIRDYAAARLADMDASAPVPVPNSRGLGEWAGQVPGSADPAALAQWAGRMPDPTANRADLSQWDARAKREFPVLRAIQSNPAGVPNEVLRGLMSGAEEVPHRFITSPKGNSFLIRGGTTLPDVDRGAVTERDEMVDRRLRESQRTTRAWNIQREINGLMKSGAQTYDPRSKAAIQKRIEELEAEHDALLEGGAGGAPAPAGAPSRGKVMGLTAAQTDNEPDGTTRTSNTTGKKQVKRNGKWVDLPSN